MKNKQIFHYISILTCCVVSLLTFVASGHSETNPTSLALNCASAIEKIRTIDALYTLTVARDPQIGYEGLTMTNREAFALGVGRRVETYLSHPELMTVELLSWDVLKKTKEPPVAILHRRLAGQTLLEYINPKVGDSLLSDYLRKESATAQIILRSSNAPDLYTIECGAETDHNKIRITMDGAHGFMPQRIEFFEKENGLFAFSELMNIKSFMLVDGDLWIPKTGSWELINTTGTNLGKPFNLEEICVDIGPVTVNKKIDPSEFQTNSTLVANCSSQGWQMRCSSDLARIINEAEQAHSQHTKKKYIKMGIIVLLILLPLAVFSIRKLVHNRS